MTARFTTMLMAPGSFTVDLDDAPELVLDLTERAFGAIIVLPVKVTNPAKVPLAQLYADATYVGIHQARPDRRGGFSGYGPAHLLRLARQASEQSVSKRPLYNGSSTSWVRNNVLRVGVAENNGLTAGPIMVAAGASSPTKGGKVPEGQEPLETLADVARRFGKEWDIVEGSKLEVAARADLFRVTPTCVATPKADGDDLNLRGLVGSRFTERDEWDDYTTEVAVPFTPPDYEFGVAYEVGDTVVASDGTFYECNSAHTSSGANLPPGTKWDARDPYGLDTLGSVPYANPFDGADIVSRRVVQARNATTYDDASDIAAAQLGRYDQHRQSITLDTKTFDLDGKVRAGDNIYAFSREHDLFDLTAEVAWRGRPAPLATVRVQEVETSIDHAMSVLFYDTASGLVDLSRWVRFEERGQRLRLGTPRRRRGPVAAGGSLVSVGFGGSL
jgi:hypothetical protein